MDSMRTFLRRLRASREKDDRGASLVEYALLIALISVVCIGAVTFFGSAASSKYSTYDVCVQWAGSGGAVPTQCQTTAN